MLENIVIVVAYFAVIHYICGINHYCADEKVVARSFCISSAMRFCYGRCGRPGFSNLRHDPLGRLPDGEIRICLPRSIS